MFITCVCPSRTRRASSSIGSGDNTLCHDGTRLRARGTRRQRDGTRIRSRVTRHGSVDVRFHSRSAKRGGGASRRESRGRASTLAGTTHQSGDSILESRDHSENFWHAIFDAARDRSHVVHTTFARRGTISTNSGIMILNRRTITHRFGTITRSRATGVAARDDMITECDSNVAARNIM